jgi:tetratricopeptide (TPR) repeat protein
MVKQRTGSKAIAPLLAEAFALHQASRFAEAEQIYARILAWEPENFDALHLSGLIFHCSGNHAGALAQIDAALRTDPDNLLALNNRGLVLNALGRFEEALASYAHALALNPDFPEVLVNRGNTLKDLRRYEAAVASYDRAIAARPDYAEAHYNRGNTLHALKRFNEAVASYDRALGLRQDYVDALTNRGITLHALRRFDEALASYERALALQPQHAAAYSHRGVTLNALMRFDEALASYDQALALWPNYAEAFTNRGVSLNALERFDEALASYSRALELEPNDADAHSNRGVTLHELGRFEEAAASCERALALRPDYAEAHSNRGNALSGLGWYAQALVSYDRALALRPDYAEALTSRGVALHQLKRFDEELLCYERALALEPDFAQAHYNQGWCWLLRGDLKRGWEKQELRWQTRQQGRVKRAFAQPQWVGSAEVAGKTILLHAEQGFGDTIQFCRYAPLVAKCGARVILEVQPPLHGLMSTLSSAICAVPRGEFLPDFDTHCPLLSLPRAFGTRLGTVPAAIPYLGADPRTVKEWDARLGRRQGARIGLAWSGNPMHKNDRNRSIPLESFLPILDGVDATFISVQRDVREVDAAVLKKRGEIQHFGQALKNFADTAALVSNLDLIVSIDTSVVHLAGALAKPVWVLLPHIPDWRWLLDREDTPWYPTARLFRQDETRAWDGVIVRVNNALRDRFGAHSFKYSGKYSLSGSRAAP